MVIYSLTHHMSLFKNIVNVLLLVVFLQSAGPVFCQVVKNTHEKHSVKAPVKWKGLSPELKILADPVDDGWLIKVEASNFKFSPEMTGRVHTPGQGHMHLYVSGKKHTRLYGGSYFLNGLTNGEHEIEVTLN